MFKETTLGYAKEMCGLRMMVEEEIRTMSNGVNK